MSYPCPKGHESEDPDFCSECGTRIAPPAAAAAAPAAAPESCPDCGTPREPGARFCEACRYDFSEQASNPAPAPSPQQPAAAPPAGPAAGPAKVPAAAPVFPDPVAAPDPSLAAVSPFYGRLAWVRVVPDRSLAGPDDAADFPEGQGETSFPLDMPESLVGRRSGRPGVHPEVPVDDRAVSGRHLKLCRRPSGMVLVDLGSTNGTRVNGAPVRAGEEVPVGPGDRIEIGAWTRLVLEAR